MSLSSGDRVGPYEVTGAIGAGGMGEVYRARDSKLNRDVALKILPEAFTADSDRVARFEREAQALASLNHPNIAQVYGLEDSAIVMELVEGDDLSVRIAQGPIPTDEALPIARQIADALSAAHEAGIIHRDLKPANIKVREDGTVKVLDFGLAKALTPDGQETSASMVANSPTLTARATELGVILGTAAYMAPEQARGKSVDRRADVWAFGVVLLEMLTGRRAFDGPEITDILAAVIKDAPPFDALPEDTAPSVRRLLERCLEKDRSKRLDSMRVAQIEIDDAAVVEDQALASQPTDAGRGIGMLVGVAAAAALVTGLGAWLVLRPEPVLPAPVAQLQLHIPQEHGQLGDLAVSDRYLAYVGDDRLYLRPLDNLEAVPVSDDPSDGPFFSPDGDWLAFWNDDARELQRVTVTGGSTLPIAAMDDFCGASWSNSDQIVFATCDGGLQLVPAAGGNSQVLRAADGRRIGPPTFTADGGAVIYIDFTEVSDDNLASAHLLPLGGGDGLVLASVLADRPFVAALPDAIVFSRDRNLLAAPFSAGSADPVGEPVTLIDDVGRGGLALSPGGVLVYDPTVRGPGTNTFVWVDRNGQEEATGIPPRNYTYGRVSPDGARAALDDRSGENDLWVWSFGPRTEIRLTTEAASDEYPVWSRDSRRVIYSEAGAEDANGEESIASVAANGTGDVERLLTKTARLAPYTVSPDGRQIVFREDAAGRNINLGLLSLDDGESRLLLDSRFSERNPEISPDGRWMAYSANETGQNEIYVRPFPDVDADKVAVSSGGGRYPLWSRDGRELFFVTDDLARLIAVAVTEGADGSLEFGPPQQLFDTTPYNFTNAGRNHDVAPDGRFLMLKSTAERSTSGPVITMWVNWLQVLRERLGGG